MYQPVWGNLHHWALYLDTHNYLYQVLGEALNFTADFAEGVIPSHSGRYIESIRVAEIQPNDLGELHRIITETQVGYMLTQVSLWVRFKYFQSFETKVELYLDRGDGRSDESRLDGGAGFSRVSFPGTRVVTVVRVIWMGVRAFLRYRSRLVVAPFMMLMLEIREVDEFVHLRGKLSLQDYSSAGPFTFFS